MIDNYEYEFNLLKCILDKSDILTNEYNVQYIDDLSVLVRFDTECLMDYVSNITFLFKEVEINYNSLVITYRVRNCFIDFDDTDYLGDNDTIYKDLYSINIDPLTKRLIMLVSRYPNKLIKKYIGDLNDDLKNSIVTFLHIKFDT